LAPDFHGYGQSGPLPQDGRPYHQHDAALVCALLDDFGGPAHLVGHSLGGTIAARVALERPDDVASLTLIEPVLFNLLEESQDPRRVEYLELAHAMMVLVRFGEGERAARLFLDYWVGPGGLDAMDDATRSYIVQTVDRVADDWFGISGFAPGALSAADFGRLSARTLLLCGEETKDSSRGISEILREAIPGVEYREVAGAGHMSPVSHTARVNEMVVDFITR
jgi:pimeloyl-ACP methyl ester carboxylesterase